jgi:hypothetical protein
VTEVEADEHTRQIDLFDDVVEAIVRASRAGDTIRRSDWIVIVNAEVARAKSFARRLESPIGTPIRSDRSLTARSVHSLNERSAGAEISPVGIRGEQGEHTLRARCERRRPRTRRGRRSWVRGRARTSAGNDTFGDAALRALVRALARQAARECFELEMKQRPSGTQ